MPLIYNDAFTDANGTNIGSHVADSGQSYEAANTSFKIHDNRLYFDNNTDNLCQVLSTTTDSEYDIAINARQLTDDGWIGIRFCADGTADNAYMVRYAVGREVELWETTGGSNAFVNQYVHGATGS